MKDLQKKELISTNGGGPNPQRDLGGINGGPIGSIPTPKPPDNYPSVTDKLNSDIGNAVTPEPQTPTYGGGTSCSGNNNNYIDRP